jgi:hypothetical protein
MVKIFMSDIVSLTADLGKAIFAYELGWFPWRSGLRADQLLRVESYDQTGAGGERCRGGRAKE